MQLVTLNKFIKRILYKCDKKYLLKHTKFFDEQYYSHTYNVPLKNVYKHYLNEGEKLGYNASIYFNSNLYRKINNDIPNDMNALLHYVVYGQYEGRKLNNSISTNVSSSSNEDFYIDKNNISLETMITLLEFKKASVFNKPSEFEKNGKYCLIFSHELNLTGAPIAIFNLILTLKEKGYTPIVISPNYGKLINNLKNENVTTIVYNEVIESNLLDPFYQLFEFIILNTLTFAKMCAKLNGTKNKVIWWIHESKVSYEALENQIVDLPKKLCDNIKIYTVGDYAKKQLLTFRPNYKTENLMYYLPDSTAKATENVLGFEKDNCISFGIVGTIEPRKGYEILLKSFEFINKKFVDKIQFIIVGKQFDAAITKKIDSYNGKVKLIHINQIEKDNMPSFYEKIDCLICPSTDDPMPIVITEAWKYKKPVITSECTGSASLIEKNGGGIVYKNNDPINLANAINDYLSGKYDTDKMLSDGYGIYDKYFSHKGFAQNLDKILVDLNKNNKILTDDLISVVIPTYNGGNDIKNLLKSLKAQEDVNLEIIIIDSGSKDGTIEFLEKEDVVLIKISQKEFSHSYARNLGAEKAKGKYLLVMTQDACPSNNHFVLDFIQPILKKEAVACVCKQTPREDADMYAKYIIYGHNTYIGLNSKDLITEYINDNPNILRTMGQLDDVSCIIDREIFLKYKYRGIYAEDLDLGTRLIKDGYNLARLASVNVIHSHTRSAYYFFTRAYVDTLFFSYNLKKDIQIINKCLTLYLIVEEIRNKVASVFDESFDWNSLEYNLMNMINDICKDFNVKNVKESLYNSKFSDNEFKKLIISLYEYQGSYKTDFDFVNSFIDNGIRQFIIYCRDNEKFENISSDCYILFIEKVFANMCGVELTYFLKNLPKEGELYNAIKKINI